MILASESASVDFPILTALVIVPVIGALAILLTSRRRPELAKLFAILSSVTAAAMSVWLLSS